MIRSILFSLLLLVTHNVFGQKSKTKVIRDATKAVAAPPSFDAELYKGLKWRNIGPFRGGRSNAVSGVPGNDQLYY
ncbi:MAG: hypothetical protein WAT46_00330, partial [Saprospiraceae bacterium]